ncbi:hotdog fold thioesterase [Gilvimarinus sp. F26214L]|uniref:hotdog fold thioesterase n=1 Tax=Gilvimarinus sp. DZF01 TaxID=3461371 RepID=UPI004045DDBB
MTESIWFRPYTIEELTERFNNRTLADYLDMKVVEIGPDYLKGEMPVSEKIHQPMGLVHGGANVALAETLGSVGANMVVDREKYACVGQEINANHVRGVREGKVTGVARPVYLGRTSQVWDIRLYDDRERLTCISRLTMAVIQHKQQG